MSTLADWGLAYQDQNVRSDDSSDSADSRAEGNGRVAYRGGIELGGDDVNTVEGERDGELANQGQNHDDRVHS